MMDLSALQAITPVAPQRAALPEPMAGASPEPGFTQLVDQGLATLNTELISAERGVQELAMGTAQSVHGVMLQLEQARLAMQIATQVRSRVIEAYQDLMRMQV